MCPFDAGRCRAGKVIVGIVLLFLFAWPGNSAAIHKKKISVTPLSNPVDWNDSFDPGALVASLLERTIKSTGRYRVLSVSGDEESGETRRHPAQVLIEGRVLVFNPKSASSNAQVDMELVLRDAFTHSVLGSERFSSTVSTGQIPFQVPEGALDFNAPVFQSSAMGKALAMSMKKATSFLDATLSKVAFEAVIISVDNDKREVVVNAGKHNGIGAFEVFYVYSMELNFIDPITQQNLGEKVARQGVIKVKTVLDNYSLAEITAGSDFKDGFVIRPRAVKSLSGGEGESWGELYGKLSP